VRAAVDAPVLCKDFIVDEVQVLAARSLGADAVLLMLSVVPDDVYRELADLAHSLGMEVLTEVSTPQEMHRASVLGAEVIGINNRNLRTLETDLARTEELAPLAPAGVVLVGESGVGAPQDVRRLSGLVDALLVGSSLSGAPDPAEAARLAAAVRPRGRESPMTRILLVEDEENFRDPLAFGLRRDGFEVVEAEDGQRAVEIFEASRRPGGVGPIDLVLLDLMLPRLDGIEVCTRIRRSSSVPVIMLTAKDTELDKIVGLEIGADDYVTKPYSYRELLARLKAVLRRSRAAAPEPEPVLVAGGVRMDVERHEVRVNGEVVAMPLREFELLELFLRHPGRVLTRNQILERLWGPDYEGDTKTLDVHVKRLRGRIEADASKPVLITTVRGLGYRLDGDSEH